MTEKPPPPKLAPGPEYEEKVHISKMPTGSISLWDVAHEVKLQAKRRLRRWISAGLIGVGGVGAGGGGLYSAEKEKARAERHRERAEQREKTEARIKEIERRLGIETHE